MNTKITKENMPIDISPTSQAWLTDKLNEALAEIEQLQAETEETTQETMPEDEAGFADGLDDDQAI